jgi:hypothetical protein
MPQVFDYTFHRLSRIGQDEINYTQDNIMNNNISNYNTYNPYSNDCLGGLDFAVKQPNVFVNKSTHQLGPLGCNVKDNSILKKGILTNPNVKLTLHERPYKTVPFLGKGNVDVYQENKIRLGDTFKEKKSVSQFNEQPFQDIANYPMQEDVKKKLQSAKIEADVNPLWMRGGTDTRILYQNVDYCKKK